MMKPSKLQWLVGIFIIFVLIGIPHIRNNTNRDQLEEVPISTVISGSKSGEVVEIIQKGNELEITRKGDDFPTQTSRIDGEINLINVGLDLTKTELRIEEPDDSKPIDLIAALLPIALILGNIVFFVVMLKHNLSRSSKDKSLWTMIIILGGILIGPLAYYFAVYQKQRTDST